MLLGAGILILDFFNNTDLALKQRQLAALCADVKKQFNISIAEIEVNDDPERGVLGFSIVIPNTWKSVSAEATLKRICELVDQTAPARLTLEDWNIIDAELSIKTRL